MNIFGFVKLKLDVVRTPSFRTRSAMSLNEALNDVEPKTSLLAIICQMFSTTRLISSSPSNDRSDKITLLRFRKLISGRFPHMPCSACFHSTTWLCVILKSSRVPWMVNEFIRLLLPNKPFLIVNLVLSPSVMLRALPKNGSRSPSSSVYSWRNEQRIQIKTHFLIKTLLNWSRLSTLGVSLNCFDIKLHAVVTWQCKSELLPELYSSKEKDESIQLCHYVDNWQTISSSIQLHFIVICNL